MKLKQMRKRVARQVWTSYRSHLTICKSIPKSVSGKFENTLITVNILLYVAKNRSGSNSFYNVSQYEYISNKYKPLNLN